MKQKIWQEGTALYVEEFATMVSRLEPFDKESLHRLVEEFTGSRKIKTGQLMNPLRLLVVGSNQGPGMMDIAVMLGKEEFLRRLYLGIKKI